MEPMTSHDASTGDDARARARALWNGPSRPSVTPWTQLDIRSVMWIAAAAAGLGVLISAAALHAPATVAGAEPVLQPTALKWLVLSSLAFLIAGGWLAVNSAISHALRRQREDQ